ncbi:hypothetical protein ACFWYW_59150, partial [Nonomuraea sp. NPDC059023]|uniref:hypothetical protein n=2 Tax=unclassified Nonomuraea TaxID=2593643 RepID=UPI0036B0A836
AGVRSIPLRSRQEITMTDAGQTATFNTIGGNTITFVYGQGSVGEWTCNGCLKARRSTVDEANDHAAQCRAQ